MHMVHAFVVQGSIGEPLQGAKAPRKPINVSLPADLLARAKELNVNISRASERGLREEVQAAEARAWAEANAGFIAEMNARIERDGLPLEEHRMF
jgi:antitoxin CcdA